ncbi:hypothetical protein QCA50_017959 [Cerrena zonata]|uniref:Uncharacterized protein n=1 Tax=Cerrena zonata TaxID=2478898 RepID=A0AAW0FQL4_9APHY
MHCAFVLRWSSSLPSCFGHIRGRNTRSRAAHEPVFGDHSGTASTTVRLCPFSTLFTSSLFSIADFAIEIAGSLKFFWDYFRGKPYARGPRETVIDNDGKEHAKMNYAEAFGFDGGISKTQGSSSAYDYNAYGQSGRSESHGPRQRPSYDENIRLAPYSYGVNQRPSAENLVHQSAS